MHLIGIELLFLIGLNSSEGLLGKKYALFLTEQTNIFKASGITEKGGVELRLHPLIHTYEKASCQVNKLNQLLTRGPLDWAHRQTPIRIHPKVSHYHAFDKRRPNHSPGLTFGGPCELTGYAQTG